MENKIDYIAIGFRTLWLTIGYLAIVSFFSPNSTMLSIEGIPFIVGTVISFILFTIGIKQTDGK